MSKAAKWSLQSKATVWSLTGRNDWDGGLSFAAPVLVNCDYRASGERLTDAKGVEFISRLRIFTEFASAKQGDYIAIGDHSASILPIGVSDAAEVRLVRRFSDTFDRLADDFEIVT